jgi:hypothetical protein
VTIEDRLRATTEAVTEVMYPVRPLDLRPSAAPAPARYRRPRRRVRWSGWLIPLAAAMAVIAVAATLVAVRSLPGAGEGSPSAPANGLPRYYVAINYTSASPKGALVQNAYLAETSTAKHLATFTPPSDAMFNYVAASSDETTFVLRALAGPNYGPSGTKLTDSELKAGIPAQTLWYVVRVTPSAPQRARLTRIPIASSFKNEPLEEAAVSPDGRTLAVVFYENGAKSPGLQTTLRTYSVATGQVLRTWTGFLTTAMGSLTWLNDGRTLAFAYPTINAPESIRTLNTARPGTSLIADSRPVFSVPAGVDCASLLPTADGKAVICGGTSPLNRGCAKGVVNLTSYSVATGKLERVLYRFPGPCLWGITQVLWAGSATLAIAEIVYTGLVSPYPQMMNTVGVVPPGKLAPLPVHLGETYDGTGSIAF